MHALATAGRPPRRWPALQVVDVCEAFHDAGVRKRMGARNSTVTPALVSVARIKHWRTSSRCAESCRISPSPPLASQFFRSDRRQFDRALKPLGQVARSSIDLEADQTVPASFVFESTS